MDVDLVRHIEQIAAQSWPAAKCTGWDGWQVRYTYGVTGRANSVLPNGPIRGCVQYHTRDRQPVRLPVTLEQQLERVEAQYCEWGLPARYQISPACQPPDLDTVLEERGYTVHAPTLVQAAEVPEVLERAGTSAASVVLRPHIDDVWFAAFCRASGHGGEDAKIRRGIMERIALRTGYAELSLEAQPAAVGLITATGEWAGLFNIATVPEFRRRGAATRIVNALAAWAVMLGVRRLYLQVEEGNAAARSLYERLGFETLYGYHYRVQPR